MSMLEREMRHLAKQAGGAHKTVSDRMAQAKRFCERLVGELNVQIRYVRHLKARHIEDYIRHRLAQGIDKRTLQNEMSAIRVILRQAGREKLADGDRISNRAVGIGGASRSGARRAIADGKYQTVQENARLKDPGLAAALELARLMGLRSQEAVRCPQSFKTWRQALARGETRLTVVFGTKGGRPRETVILDTIAVKKALENAINIAEQRNGRLIDKADLKSAMNYWRGQAGQLGLTGKNTPHSLRYAWAQDAIRHYLAQGFCKKEALAMVAMDLGHGDGRGRYVAQVYGLRGED
ncbi:DNA-binding protein [Salmonella enterica]|uniref:integrase domain-containing protein n=1 Tax=Citrobacter sp. CFNIH10 TaxID=1920110 RepID=UPI000CEBC1CF|nr:integrase domain-containing protein [Citrobacter sp. CFNIH10]ECC3761086.1 DNA-binding protein [Salmonella enterica]ECK7271957.1 DNA-binding protein [Salmonella enterica subsp. enterica serovar Budapest]EKY5001962.1 integrase domain-containing protein [Citrobacter amalonaticus]AUZ66969.1 DNA-binding protein [Citrobacter sp. CFNIH10]HBB6760341.1 integrase domain-containing protein [Citrobacter amalonaticus]